MLETGATPGGVARFVAVTDRDPAKPVITESALRYRLGRLSALLPSDPAVTAVLRITAVALLVTLLLWVFR